MTETPRPMLDTETAIRHNGHGTDVLRVVAPSDRRVERLRFAGAFAFVGSGCLLVLELVAGRILAPTIGVSLYTWTSIIGVVLAGVSFGNYLGGRVADRWPGRRALSSIYILSGMSSALVLLLARDLEFVAAPHSTPAILQVVWLTALLFFLPSTLLAMATPMLVKLSLESVGSAGRVVGRIQAAATLGSIVGTFATGFFLISWFGTRALVAGVAGALLVLGALVYPVWSRRRVIDLTAAALLIMTLAAASGSECLRESNYYCIRVVPGPGENVRALVLDNLVHGYVDLNSPTRLIYPYELLYDEVIRAVRSTGPMHAFAIGGGAYTFPRYAERELGASVLVAEVDPAVTAVARSHLALRPSPAMEIVHNDARRVLMDRPADERFDIVLGDAFSDAAVPYHLTTKEFNDLLASHMSETGVYLINVVDAVNHDFLRSFMKTLQQTFPSVRILRNDRRPFRAERDTFVVAASKTTLPWTASMMSASTVDQFSSRKPSRVLTDDHVPVDQLLAPVFRQRMES